MGPAVIRCVPIRRGGVWCHPGAAHAPGVSECWSADALHGFAGVRDEWSAPRLGPGRLPEAAIRPTSGHPNTCSMSFFSALRPPRGPGSGASGCSPVQDSMERGLLHVEPSVERAGFQGWPELIVVVAVIRLCSPALAMPSFSRSGSRPRSAPRLRDGVGPQSRTAVAISRNYQRLLRQVSGPASVPHGLGAGTIWSELRDPRARSHQSRQRPAISGGVTRSSPTRGAQSRRDVHRDRPEDLAHSGVVVVSATGG